MKINSSKKFAAIAFIVFLLLNISVCAGTAVLSPGLSILGKGLEIEKCGVVNNDVYFSPSDFDKALGTDKVEYVTITKLPDSSCGVLKISGTDVLENQTISRKSLELLRYVPGYNTLSTGSFSFRNAMKEGGMTANCIVHILSDINLAPETASQDITTQKNISAFKFMKAADPENDKLCFEFAKLPENGKIKLIDSTAGYFEYTPKNGFTGKDEFTYKVSDQYGNTSKSQTVKIRVTKPQASVTYSDLTKHWAYNSALKMTSLGLMSGEKVNGKLVFKPNENVTRGDFLAMAMIITGHEKDVKLCNATTFADDSKIPLNIKSYAEKAMSMGVISGYPVKTGGYDFNSTKTITRAEASVILDRLIDSPAPKIAPKFTDTATIPTWAKNSVSTLASCGILKGTGYGAILPDQTVTKAEAAEMLCNAKDYIEQKNSLKTKKTFSNLFGLIK